MRRTPILSSICILILLFGLKSVCFGQKNSDSKSDEPKKNVYSGLVKVEPINFAFGEFSVGAGQYYQVEVGKTFYSVGSEIIFHG